MKFFLEEFLNEESVRDTQLYLYRASAPNPSIPITLEFCNTRIFQTDYASIVRERGDAFVDDRITTRPGNRLAFSLSPQEALAKNTFTHMTRLLPQTAALLSTITDPVSEEKEALVKNDKEGNR